MNVLAFVYEVAPLKRQAAVIQILIKGMAFCVDFQFGYSEPYMITGTNGAM